jgi:uncharacterized protein YndB with AHSA1/START domain
VYTTRVSQHVRAAPSVVYRALLDAGAVARWRAPTGMRGEVHEFDPREGGTFRVSLTYETSDGVGKTTAHTDTYRGRFARLVPDELVVEELAFEAEDPALRGTMTMTTTLTASGDGTDVSMVHEGVPDRVPPPDNELGMRIALASLAALVEGERPT